MWQRIQTVFLVLSILSLIMAILFPIWSHNAVGQSHKLFAFHYSIIGQSGEMITTEYMPYCLTAILAIASITLSVIEIGKYRNRMLQMKLGALNSLFLAGTILSGFVFANGLTEEFQGGTFGLGLWLPGAAVLFNLLANFFIRKDERLVRDSKRLR
jgi:hypothetical protein